MVEALCVSLTRTSLSLSGLQLELQLPQLLYALNNAGNFLFIHSFVFFCAIFLIRFDGDSDHECAKKNEINYISNILNEKKNQTYSSFQMGFLNVEHVCLFELYERILALIHSLYQISQLNRPVRMVEQIS